MYSIFKSGWIWFLITFKAENFDMLEGFTVPSGLVRFYGIQSDRNNICMKKIMIETRIYSGSRINLLIMIDRTRDTKSRIGSTPLY
jgi:hypothetical protein